MIGGDRPVDGLLGQQLPEAGNNVADEIRHVLKRFERRFALDNPRFVERYVSAEGHFVIHFKIDGLAIEFVAYLQGKEFVGGEYKKTLEVKPSEHFSELIPAVNPSPNTGNIDSTEKASCTNEQLMLAELVQFVQLPENMPLPAFVRLGCIDCIYNLLPNALYLSATRGFVIRGFPSDRVIHEPIRLRAAARRQHQLVGNMIEGTSQVLDYIGGNGCQRIWDAISFRDVINMLTGLRVVLDGKFVGVGVVESLQSKMKILDVLFGPCDHRIDAINRTSHD